MKQVFQKTFLQRVALKNKIRRQAIRKKEIFQRAKKNPTPRPHNFSNDPSLSTDDTWHNTNIITEAHVPIRGMASTLGMLTAISAR